MEEDGASRNTSQGEATAEFESSAEEALARLREGVRGLKRSLAAADVELETVRAGLRVRRRRQGDGGGASEEAGGVSEGRNLKPGA
ncbi:unnamed protein product, partial [Heterosigma akashiwo]